MKKIQLAIIIFISLFFFNSCSKNDDDTPTCPQIENISMKINGEAKQFLMLGRGIDLDRDGSGHTLTLDLFAGTVSPPQDSYEIILKLPYKKTGSNIIEKFNYYRVHYPSSLKGNFVLGKLESKVTVNKNTCFRATFSGRATIDGVEIIITEGIIDHSYSDPFDD